MAQYVDSLCLFAIVCYLSQSAYMYEQMLKSIKEVAEERGLEIKLESFRPDFERATIEAVKAVFHT